MGNTQQEYEKHCSNATLVVITPFFMFNHSPTDISRFKKFQTNLKVLQHVDHWVVECAFDGQELFAVTDPYNQQHLRVRTSDKINIKQSLINYALSKLPSTTKYIACLDYNIELSNKDWPTQALIKLQTCDVVQLFETFVYRDLKGLDTIKNKGLFYQVLKDRNYQNTVIKELQKSVALSSVTTKCQQVGHAWAMTAAYREQISKLFDNNVFSNAATLLYYGIVDCPLINKSKLKEDSKFKKQIEYWAINAVPFRQIGTLQGTAKQYQTATQSTIGRMETLEIDLDPQNQLTVNMDEIVCIKDAELHKKVLQIVAEVDYTSVMKESNRITVNESTKNSKKYLETPLKRGKQNSNQNGFDEPEMVVGQELQTSKVRFLR